MPAIPTTTDKEVLSKIVKVKLPDKTRKFVTAKKTKYFNCFSFVMYMFDSTKKLDWAEEYEVRDFVELETKKIKTPKRGDIAVYKTKRGNDHTAIVISPSKIIHKPGGFPLETSKIYDNYYTNDNPKIKIEFRRYKAA